MSQVILALLPVGLLLALGWSLGILRFPDEHFWPALDRFIYLVLLPVLLIRTALNTDAPILAMLPIGLATVSALILLTVVLISVRRFVATTGAAFSSIVQGSVRVNVYAGFAVASALYGDRGVVLFSVVIALAVPIDNVLSIAVLNRFAAPTRLRWASLLRRMAINPLILALIIGFSLRGLGVQPGRILREVMELLSGATLPLALLTVGAGFQLQNLGSAIRPLVIAVMARQFALPLIAYSICLLMGLTGPERGVVLLHAALPTGPAAYAVAKQMGGDAPLMANIITVTTLCAGLSVPLWILFLG